MYYFGSNSSIVVDHILSIIMYGMARVPGGCLLFCLAHTNAHIHTGAHRTEHCYPTETELVRYRRRHLLSYSSGDEVVVLPYDTIRSLTLEKVGRCERRNERNCHHHCVSLGALHCKQGYFTHNSNYCIKQ